MKKMAALLICVVLVLAGCANKEAYTGYRASFDQAAEDYYKAVKTPLLSIELPSPVKGQPYKLEVGRDVKFMGPSQIKDSEWVGPVAAGFGVVGIVANNWITRHYQSKDYVTLREGGGGINTNGGAVTIKDAYNKSETRATGGSATTTTGSPVTTTEIVDPGTEIE